MFRVEFSFVLHEPAQEKAKFRSNLVRWMKDSQRCTSPEDSDVVPQHTSRTAVQGNACRDLWSGDPSQQWFHPLEALLLVTMLDGFAKTEADRNVAMVMALSNLVAFPIVNLPQMPRIRLRVGPMASCTGVDPHGICVHIEQDVQLGYYHSNCADTAFYQDALCPSIWPLR